MSDEILYLVAGLVGLLVCVFLFDAFIPPPNVIDITTSVISTDIDSHGNPVLNTEVGNFKFNSESHSRDVDFMITNSIYKYKPIVLHISNGYVTSFTYVNNNMGEYHECNRL